MLPTDLTVSAVVEQDGKFLIVEERSSGVVVLNQPGGHIESGEAPEQAVVREALEEAGCQIEVAELLGVYLWIHPQTRQQFLRIVYTAELLSQDTTRQLDDGVYAVHWFSIADLRHRQKDLRTPVVSRCVEDYLTGDRQSDTFLTEIMPVQQNVGLVLANARLI
ncbi:MAG: NUDIX hydrolase [Gammaproteobacteria bacterium]|nr:MAG: NUDIX hydrolase [Gammaproteobacteria bacterium]RLA35454.1 MAG: NUDIX hydrolase [Gammaproteobacteria bacterium]